jgi:hypothetical protein
MRDRGLLHFSQVDALTEWAAKRGWKQEPTKADFEVLRLRNGKQCAIFHRKSLAKEHLTVWGDSERLAREFVRWTHAREEAMAAQPQRASA